MLSDWYKKLKRRTTESLFPNKALKFSLMQAAIMVRIHTTRSMWHVTGNLCFVELFSTTANGVSNDAHLFCSTTAEAVKDEKLPESRI